MTERGGPIAVLGAGGAVGGSVAETVAGLSLGRIRLGARKPEALAPLVTRLAGQAEAVAVDAADPQGLARFCSGCRVLVNCAGSAGVSRAGAADAALAAGAHYVDPGGDQMLQRELAARPAARGSAILGAGVLPGLAALVPRWLARDLHAPLALTAYLGTQDRMTRASAAEFLLSLASGDGAASAMWRAGVRVPHRLEPQRLSLPFFDGDVVAYPHLSAEAEWLARRLPLDEVRWYIVFDDDRPVATLSRLVDQLRLGAPLAELADDLVRAIDVEMFGRAPQQQLVFELAGRSAGQLVSRVAVLRASSTYQLSATVTALTVAQALNGTLPVGAHFAAAVLDPAVVDALVGLPGLAGLHVLDGPLAAYEQAVQGTV